MSSRGPGFQRRRVTHVLKQAARRVAGASADPDDTRTERRLPAPSEGAVPPGPAPIPLLETLRRGGSLHAAMTKQIRADVAGGRSEVALAVAASLRGRSETADLGALVSGVVAFRRGYPDLAWHHLAELPMVIWSQHAAEEYVRSGLHVDPDATVTAVRDLLTAAPDELSASSWFSMIGPFFGHGDLELAAHLFAKLDQLVGDGRGLDPALAVNRDWLRPWISRSPEPVSAPAVAPDKVSFAIMDYGHPGRARASANIGDHVQSLASLGHLVRHQGLEFSGPQDLLDLIHQLRGRVREDRQLTEVTASVELLAVDRDASEFSAIPPDTWTLAFGWFMHAIFDMRYGFPFHPNLRPIFVSFHCSKRDLLTEQAIDYLRKHAPIGCRDWTTVDVLLSVDVPAFFSGCMTTTVSTVFPDTPHKPGAAAQVAYVDVPDDEVPAGAPTYRHSDDAIRFRSFAANMYDAIELLETYRREHSGLVTSRLHCYLPGRSIGVPVDFQPGNRSDPRFAGLIDITDNEFDRMRESITSKLRTVLSVALAGRPPEEVYELWRDLNADDVAAARRRHDAPAQMPVSKVDLAAEAAGQLASRELVQVGPDVVHVVVHARGLDQRNLVVMLASVVARSSRPVAAWVLTRKPGRIDLEALRTAVPGMEAVTVLSTRGLGSDVRRADGRRPAPRDLDMLALSHLLPELDRVVVLPAAALVLGDVAALADVDLAGGLLAATTSVGQKGSSGFEVLHAAGNRLGPRTAASTELRRQGHQRHRFDFDALDDAVLVLDLAEARRRRLLETYTSYIEEFGLSFREILLLEVGPNRVALPEAWHVVPDRSAVEEPKLIHWADSGKPWAADVVGFQELWQRAAADVR